MREASLDHPMRLRPDERLYLELDHCYVSADNRVRVSPDPVGQTTVYVSTKSGYVAGDKLTSVQIPIQDARTAGDSQPLE